MCNRSILFPQMSVLAVCSTVMLARPPITPPTLDELREHSDLVCVLQVRSVTESQNPHPKNPSPETVKSYIATCKVVCAFKGNTTNGEIQISFYGHFFDLPERRAVAPLVETKQGRLEDAVQYLAFLKRGKEGMFVPSCGDLDPGFSFRILLQSFDLDAAKILRQRQSQRKESGAANRRQPIRSLVATEYAKWSWSRELPKEVATECPATNRTPVAVDELFKRDSPPPTVDKVIATLGRPDGFSQQALYSKTQGTAQPQKAGGTLRFLLGGGGELLVRTGDFHLIYEAIRYEKGGRANLLAK